MNLLCINRLIDETEWIDLHQCIDILIINNSKNM